MEFHLKLALTRFVKGLLLGQYLKFLTDQPMYSGQSHKVINMKGLNFWPVKH